MEKLFLHALLMGEELDIINQQDVHVAELIAEGGHAVIAQGIDQLVGELFAGDVADGRLRLASLDLMTDGLHEMGLAHAYAAIDEQRVVGLGRTLRYGLGRRVGKLVAGAYDKSIKRVLWT